MDKTERRRIRQIKEMRRDGTLKARSPRVVIYVDPLSGKVSRNPRT